MDEISGTHIRAQMNEFQYKIERTDEKPLGTFRGFKIGASTRTTYNINQIHFHAPGEHTINGKTFDLEMHIVTSYETDVPGDRNWAVLTMLF
jgi:hypothetical protein